jgi:multiple sugar transport system permease protein
MLGRRNLLLLLPLGLGLLAVIGWPLVQTVWLSFTDAQLGDATGDFVGLANYAHALRSHGFRHALQVTLTFSLSTVVIEMVLGLLVGLLLDLPLRGRNILRGLLLIPWALPTVINAMAWRVIYNPDFGALNALLTQTGIIGAYRSWLGEPGIALTAIAAADIWKTFPFVALITLAGLQNVPRELKEAALIDGANAWGRFRAVILPAIITPLTIAAVLRIIDTIKVFDIIWIMTRGGPANATKSLSIMVYEQAFSFGNAGYGAAIALLSVAISVVLIGGYMRVSRAQPATA